MNESFNTAVKKTCKRFGNDPNRMIDVVRQVQRELGCVNAEAIDLIAADLSVPRVEVQSCVSFYAFLSEEPKGKVIIRLSDDIIDKMHGYDRVAVAFCQELGIEIGETTPDGAITLERTGCIGMCDQPPAALINDVVVTNLSTDAARDIVRELRKHMDPSRLVKHLGDGANSHELVHSMVENNIRREGELIFTPVNPGEAIRKALALSPREVIRAVKTARLRGRGGSGFPTGMKWEFARASGGDRRFIICNADEGEPGTFKDRVLLTERPGRVFAGMTIAGYAIGAQEGIVYLRAEYSYLKEYLEDVLQKRRERGLLGENITGVFRADGNGGEERMRSFRRVHDTDKNGFRFDIRIQMGAGAYVCGEETALINSCEGMRGDPKNRPPFPAHKGYLGCPTVVNNVETLCCVTKILEDGPATFNEFGSKQSSGTKVLSVSGDCQSPGIYEVPLGVPLRMVLDWAGARDAIAVQVGGPSGQMVPPDQFHREICFDDLATGGAIMVFGPGRDLLQVVHAFLEFFVDESCGYCTPCRVGNVLLKEGIERIIEGRGEPGDLDYLQKLGESIKTTSRCGLGQTSPNPVLTTLKNFRSLYEARVEEDPDGYRRSFDMKAALAEAEAIAGRDSVNSH